MRTRRNSGISGSERDERVKGNRTRATSRGKPSEYDEDIHEHDDREHADESDTEDDAEVEAASVGDRASVLWMQEQLATMVNNAAKGASKGRLSETSHRKQSRREGSYGRTENARMHKSVDKGMGRRLGRGVHPEDSHGWEAESERSDEGQNGTPPHNNDDSDADSGDDTKHTPERTEHLRGSGSGRKFTGAGADKRTKQYKRQQTSGGDENGRTQRSDREIRRDNDKERARDRGSPRKLPHQRTLTVEEAMQRAAKQLEKDAQNKRKRGRPRKGGLTGTQNTYGRSPAVDSDAFVRRSTRAKRPKYDNLNDGILKISNGVYEEGDHSDDGAEKPDSDGAEDSAAPDSDENAPDSVDEGQARNSDGDEDEDEQQSGDQAPDDSGTEEEEETIDVDAANVYTRRRSSSRLMARDALVQEQPNLRNNHQAVNGRRGRKKGRPTWRGRALAEARQTTRTHSHTRTHANDSSSEEEGENNDDQDDMEDSEDDDEDVPHSRQHLRSTRRPGLRARVAKQQNPYDRYIVTRPSAANTKRLNRNIRERNSLAEPTPEMQPKKYILAKAKEEGKTNLGPSNRRYFFRNTIPAVQRFKPPTPKSNSKGPNRQTILFNDARLPRGRDGRSSGNRRRKASNYDFSGSSGDEDRNFEAAHKRSVMRARKEFMPLNMTSEEMEETARARGRHGTSALADIEPMECDKEVGFTDIGGLDRTIDTLKEMVIFPLLYPEFYDHFKVKSARGILLHGPPGTGKTLVARALANECTKVGCQKVAFFMRKGSDCLSKWVGESERQLRLLFDQAYLLRPSVIFFDEIDGLAPIRSTRQDQIHSSIVSTLLALMDGLDDRGQVIVIGATNRLDAIDPALRRPGRFDREFLFARPNQQTRAEILKIHTKGWNPPLSNETLSHLAQSTAGYCGADLKALVASSAVHSLKSKYPQIYQSNSKLQIDVKSLSIDKSCFNRAMKDIQPSANRSNEAHARAVPNDLRPLLSGLVQSIHKEVKKAQMPISVHSGHPLWSAVVDRTNRRLLITGTEGMGQTKYLAPAVMYELEIEPVYNLGIQSLLSIGGAGAGTYATPEEACINTFREAYRAQQALLYVPNINRWWEWATPVLKQVFMTMLRDAPPASQLFVMATCDEGAQAMPYKCMELFGSHQTVSVAPLNTRDPFVAYFADLKEMAQAPVYLAGYQAGAYEALPLAEALPKKATDLIDDVQLDQAERKRMERRVQWVQRELRIVLRVFTEKLLKERAFHAFWHPVDTELNPDYLKKISTPMDLSTLLLQVDNRKYATPNCWIKDIDVIVANCKQYLSGTEPVLRRAYALEDRAYGMIDELDDDFVRLCEDTHKLALKLTPALIGSARSNALTSTTSQPHHPTPPGAARVSLRKRGIEPEIAVDDALSLMKATSHSDSKSRLQTDQSPGQEVPQALTQTDPMEEDDADANVAQGNQSEPSDVRDNESDEGETPENLQSSGASGQEKPKPARKPIVNFDEELRKLQREMEARKARAKSDSGPSSAKASVHASRLESSDSRTLENGSRLPADLSSDPIKSLTQSPSATYTLANTHTPSESPAVVMVTRIEFTDTGIVQDRDVLVVVEEEGSDHAHTVNATTVTQYSAGASAGVNTQQQQAELKRRRDIVRLATVEVMGDLATAGEAEVSAVATRCTADRPGVVEKEKGVSGAAPAGNAAGEQEGVVSINRTESSPPAAHMRVTNGVGNSPSGVERLSENEVSHGMSETARQGTTEAPFNDRTDDTRARTMNGEAIPMFGGGAAVSEVPAHDATHTINRELVSDGLGVGNEACGNRADSSTRPVEVTETAPGGTEASSATAEPGTGQLAGADALVTTLEANDANAQRNTIGSVLKAADEGAGVLDLGMANVRDADDGSLDVVQALHSEDWEDWEHVETPMLRVDAAGVDQFFDDVIDACLGQPTLKIERLRAALVRTIGVYIQEFDRQVMVDDLRICLRNVLQ